MPNLGDFLGQLISELLIARAQADLESLRIAEAYKSDSLLKHFSIPRFRLPTVTLDVPVAIKEVSPITEDKKPGGVVIYSDEIAKNILKDVIVQFDNLRVKHIDTEITKMEKEVKIYLSQTLSDTQAHKIQDIADQIADTLAKGLVAQPEILTKKTSEGILLKKRITDVIKKHLIQHTTMPPRLGIIVNTKELIEIGRDDLFIRLNLSFTESGVEWTVIESDDKLEDKLIPE